MGRTNPTFRRNLRQIEQDWQPYRRGLRRHDQDMFDILFDHAESHADAAGQMNPHRPMDAVLLSILIEQQNAIEQLRDRLE